MNYYENLTCGGPIRCTLTSTTPLGIDGWALMLGGSVLIILWTLLWFYIFNRRYSKLNEMEVKNE